MPIIYQVSSNGGVVVADATGHATAQQLRDYEWALFTDSAIRPDFLELFDATFAVRFDLTIELMEELVEIDRQHADKLGRGKTAIVIPRNRQFAIAQHYEKLRTGVGNVMLFYNRGVAETWLGIRTAELVLGPPVTPPLTHP